MSFLLYILGFIVFIAGLACVATLLGISQAYILVGAGILLVVGLFTAAMQARTRDPV